MSLAALKDWTFLLGPGFIVGWGNGLILAYLMYKSRLVPRAMTWFGLIGGPLIILSGIGVLFDVFDAGSPVQGLATAPEFIWELSLGIYCATKGFKRDSPILAQSAPAEPTPRVAHAPHAHGRRDILQHLTQSQVNELQPRAPHPPPSKSQRRWGLFGVSVFNASRVRGRRPSGCFR